MQNDNNLKKQLIEFAASEFGVEVERITMDTDIYRGLGVDGDDVTDFMEAFSDKFKVNLDDFRWYHHGGPEGCNPFWFFIRPWWARKTYIPVTVRVLLEPVRSGRWVVEYPEKEKETDTG